MQKELPPIRRRKRPPHLSLSTIAKAIRTSLYGASPLSSPKGSSPVEMTNYSPVISPPALITPDTPPSRSVEGSPKRRSPLERSLRKSLSPSYELNNNKKILSIFSPRTSSDEISGLLCPPTDNLSWRYGCDRHSDSEGNNSPLSPRPSSVTSVKSLSLTRRGTPSEDENAPSNNGHYTKNANGNQLSNSYATIRFTKQKKKATRTRSIEDCHPDGERDKWDQCKENNEVKSPQTGPRRGVRRATLGHIYRSEHKKNNGWSNVDVLGDGRGISKTEKKNLEKTNKLNIHLIALFNAVEYGQLEKARTILQNNTFSINSVNQDGFTVLDIAVLTGNWSIVRTLQQAGATESNAGDLAHHLDDLLFSAEKKRSELSGAMVGGNYPKETEKEHLKWERRVKFLRKMKSGLEKLQIPKAPQSASVEVIDGTRVRIGFQESQQPLHQQNVVITKYKVEWSVDEWKNVEGHVELFDLRRMSAVIEGLSQGRRHHFRICAGNVRGYGPTVATTPPSAVPSSWRDIDNRKPRMDGLLWELEDLFKQVRNSRPEHASEIKAIEPGQETPLVQRKAQKKKSLMQLFTHAPKFQKSLKRGSYFACIVFCDDKILVTTEDFPPVVEVDENYLSQAKIHFHWLMKVATTWEDVKSLRQDMEQAGSASHLPYRIKLLQAAANMQSVLGLQDLGQFYHKPIKDSSGTYVFCTVKHVKSTKAVSAMNVRWVPLAKLREKKTTGQGTNSGNNETPLTAGDMLINSLQEQITYSQVSQVPLRRGLYLGYLKLQSSVDQLQVIVPGRIPNMFPHIKVRDNPHVSREEWEWLQNLKQHSWRKSDDPGGGGEKDNSKNNDSPSPAQAAWRKQLVSGVQRLLQELNIEEGKWSLHRLFTGEVLELNSDVTLLLLLPPLDAVCCVPGQEDILLTQASLMALPLHTFEMVHMGTYQGHLLGRYTRLSYILEMDMVMAQHSSREAFSEIEVSRAKERLWQLKQFQVLLDGIWKRFRWVMDVITFARDKAVTGLPLTALCQSIGQKSGNHFMDTSEIVLNSLSVSKEYKRFSYDSRFSSGKIKTNYGVMLKSKTAENIRQLASDSESRLPKSKTSDCVFLSSESLTICSSSDNYSQQNPSSECIPPIIQWKAEDTCLGPHESHMYTKNTLATKSDYLLQQYSEIEPPPRKSSAPSFLGSDTEQTLPGSEPLPRSKSSVSNYNLYSNSSSSLNTLGIKVEEKSSRGTIGERSLIPIGKGSPSTSCSNLTSQKFSTVSGNTEKRASSSMSHESAASFSSMSPASLRSVSSSNDNETDGGTSIEGSAAAVEEERAKRPNEPAIIQVYAAYDTGLAPGTSVKLHVTPRTTCREVIDLVVKQLNMAVLLKNKNGPIYGNEKLKDFCLVAVIGARERCLRDDFRPVQLQNPWKKGRLFVRLRNDVLAAIEQNNAKHTSYL